MYISLLFLHSYLTTSIDTSFLPKVSEEVIQEALNVKNGKNEEAEEARGNFLDLFRYPNLRRKTLNLFFNWFVGLRFYEIEKKSVNDRT